MLDRILDGRTDLVFDYLANGHVATGKDKKGAPLGGFWDICIPPRSH